MNDEKSDYMRKRRSITVLARDIIDTVAAREWWKVDDSGRKHFRRRLPYVPPPPNVPPPPIEPPPPPPADGVFGRVLHDFEFFPRNADGSYVSRPDWTNAPAKTKGLPETVKARDSEWVELTRAWQFFSFDLLWKANPYLSKADAIDLFRKVYRANAFKTNQKAPPREYANYVTGEGLGYPPMRTEIIWTGGAYLHILGSETARGTECWRVEMLNIHDAPPSVNIFDGKNQSPTVYLATTSNRANGGTLVMPLTGGPAVAIPSVANRDYALIDKQRVEILPAGSPPPTPYNFIQPRS